MLIAHAVATVLSVGWEICEHAESHFLKQFFDIARIPCFFFVWVYAAYKGTYSQGDADNCEYGEYPMAEMMIYLDLIIITLWLLGTPIFYFFTKLLGYETI